MSTHIDNHHLMKVSLLDVLALLGTSIILAVAFYYQLFMHELPCPLCLLQRVGIIIIGLGFLPNVISGFEHKNYSIVLLGCIITGVVATRQILLHILPGDQGFGSTFLGLHFYTWSLIATVGFLTFIAIALIFNANDIFLVSINSIHYLKTIIVMLFISMLVMNLISTFIECGFGQCADNPIAYKLLGHIA